jgi:molybdate transport system substrate-binding protein
MAAGCGQGDGAKPAKGGLSGSISVHCASGVKDAVTEVKKGFEAETGVVVNLNFGNSGQLLGQIELSRLGDVYIPGDIGYIEMAREKKLTAGAGRVFCHFVPVILVRKGNPKKIGGLEDLAKPGMRLALAEGNAAIGKLQAEMFRKNGLDLEAIRKNTVDTPVTVTDVALKVKLGAADAGLVWDAVAAQYSEDTEAVAIPLARNVIGQVPAAVLVCARNPKAAEAFVEYLVSEKGRKVLAAKHFSVDAPQ